MSLRHRLDQLLENFTAELVRVVAAHSRELLRTTAAPSVKPASRRAPAKGKAAPKSPVRAPKAPRAAAPPKPTAPPRPAPAPKRIAGAPRIVPAPAPVARTAGALERALLSALRASPVSLADLLESAGIDADELAEARTLVQSLIARGLIGESTFSGAPLLFAKSPVRAPAKRRPRATPTATATASSTPLLETTPAAAPAPEAAWRPTVIRRKKAVASGTEGPGAEG